MSDKLAKGTRADADIDSSRVEGSSELGLVGARRRIVRDLSGSGRDDFDQPVPELDSNAPERLVRIGAAISPTVRWSCVSARNTLTSLTWSKARQPLSTPSFATLRQRSGRTRFTPQDLYQETGASRATAHRLPVSRLRRPRAQASSAWQLRRCGETVTRETWGTSETVATVSGRTGASTYYEQLNCLTSINSNSCISCLMCYARARPYCLMKTFDPLQFEASNEQSAALHSARRRAVRRGRFAHGDLGSEIVRHRAERNAALRGAA